MALNRAGTSGGVAIVTTEMAGEGDLATMRRLGSRFGSVALVVIEASAWDPAAVTRSASVARGATRVIRVTADRPFAAAWNQAVPFQPGRVPIVVRR
jgi:hypothetical protein